MIDPNILDLASLLVRPKQTKPTKVIKSNKLIIKEELIEASVGDDFSTIHNIEEVESPTLYELNNIDKDIEEFNLPMELQN